MFVVCRCLLFVLVCCFFLLFVELVCFRPVFVFRCLLLVVRGLMFLVRC